VHAYRAHLYAASLHNTYGRLGRIGAPTLVVHGAEDRMIPVANAHLMAERIPGAQLRILEDSGHLYPTDEPGIDAEIGAFIEAH
jgi:pimeloyl-ACP methyl ester carboxylesterase